ncbi:MAG: carboxypeptidase-like regulatory domain-containing protein [Mucilaginibacter sp.]
MSNEEIITYLSSNNNVCGRFNNEQIPGINKKLRIPDGSLFQMKGWALVLSLLSPMVFGNVRAQMRIPTEQTTSGLRNECSGRTIGKIVSMQTVRGQVTDEQGAPIPLAKIIFTQGETHGTMTDEAGNFSVQVLSGYTKFRVVTQGYLPQDVDIIRGTVRYHVKLKNEEMLLGTIAKVKQPFFKYVYYRYFPQSYRKVFK